MYKHRNVHFILGSTIIAFLVCSGILGPLFPSISPVSAQASQPDIKNPRIYPNLPEIYENFTIIVNVIPDSGEGDWIENVTV